MSTCPYYITISFLTPLIFYNSAHLMPINAFRGIGEPLNSDRECMSPLDTWTTPSVLTCNPCQPAASLTMLHCQCYTTKNKP